MLMATTISTADSAASGMYFASGAATSTITSSVSAWTMPATGVRAPVRTFVAVRAMAPVAGMPPNSGATRLAMPCAISSWLGSWRSPIIVSATRADSSDSIAPSSAMVIVGAIRSRIVDSDSTGSANSGSPVGMPPKRVPMVASGSREQRRTRSTPRRARRSARACGRAGPRRGAWSARARDRAAAATAPATRAPRRPAPHRSSVPPSATAAARRATARRRSCRARGARRRW